jgi:hypothetical protein
LLGGVICDAGEDVGEPRFGIHIVQLAGLCRAQNYAEQFGQRPPLVRCRRRSRGQRLRSIRHSSVVQRASRKASKRSLG